MLCTPVPDLLCCSVARSTWAEELVSPPSDKADNQNTAQHADPPPQQQETPVMDQEQEEEARSPPPSATDTLQQPHAGHNSLNTNMMNNTQMPDDAAKPVTTDDVTVSSTQVPPEDVPIMYSDTNGHKPSPQHQVDEGKSGESEPVLLGSPMDPVTPSGGETVKLGDAERPDATPPSSERSELENLKKDEAVKEPLSTLSGQGAIPGEEGLPDVVMQSGPGGDAPSQEPTGDKTTEDPATRKPDEGGGKVSGAKTGGLPPEISKPESEEKMPSFDEWKQEMLAEQKQAQQAKQAKQGTVNGHAFQPVSGTVTNPKLKGASRVNYASSSCGAKMITANVEAKNSGFILTENKDQYMIQPCHAKKWFVVELCEFITIQSLEVANLELFSSLPESFIVHTSERYPTKEWKTLGTFRARDERAVQSFPITDEEMFAKYIKVEPLTHYGDEHYCPLTILRVYGTTVVEDYEEADQAESAGDDDDHPQEEPANLVTIATDTVISLVKTVLSPGDKNGIVQMNGTAINGSVVNGTAALPGGAVQANPCTPTAMNGESGGNENCIVGEGEPQTPNVSDVAPLVTLIESRPHAEVNVFQRIPKCNFCQDAARPSCYADRAHICGYYRATNFVLDTNCASMPGIRASVKVKGEQGFPSPRGRLKVGKGGLARAADSVGSHKVEPIQVISDDGDVTGESVEQPDVRTHKVLPVPSDRAMPGAVPEPPKAVPLEPSLHIDSKHPTTSPEVAMSQTTFETPSGSTHIETSAFGTTVSDGIQTKPAVPVTASCDPLLSECSTMGPDLVQIRPTTTEEAAMRSTEPTEQNDSTPPAKLTDNIQASKTVKSPGGAGGTPLSNVGSPAGTGPLGTGDSQSGAENGAMPVNERVIHAETPPQDPDYELEKLALPDDGEPIQKLSSRRRETALVKLRNRIKELELNLNLSSRYLEELSQRYRRQMENMYPTLNKTIQKLINTSRAAEQKDLWQQSNITELMRHINLLTKQMHQLTDDFNNLHTQVIERHLFLMMVEGIVFLLIVTWLLNRIHQPTGRVRHLTPTRAVQSTLSSPTTHTALRPPIQNTKPPDKHKKGTQHKMERRNSIDATPPRPRVSSFVSKQRSKDDIGLRLSGSKTSLGTEVPAAAAIVSASPEFKEIANRKKKKKKQNKLLQTMSHPKSSIPISGQPASAGSFTTHMHHNVGLIFSSKVNTNDPSPPLSTASSESGDSGVSQVNASGQHAVSRLSQHSTNNNHSKASACRSLNLQDTQRAGSSVTSGGSGNTMVRKNHKRQRSDGALPTKTQNCNFTNIGPNHATFKGSNRKQFLGKDNKGPPGQSDITSWRGWLGGTRK